MTDKKTTLIAYATMLTVYICGVLIGREVGLLEALLYLHLFFFGWMLLPKSAQLIVFIALWIDMKVQNKK